MWPFQSFPTDLVARKLAARDAALATAQPYDPAVHDGFLKASASEIASRVSSGEWTAADVLEAFIARAAHAHKSTNAVTEVLFAEARARAQQLDDDFARTGKPVGPLHGVPMTLKDKFDYVGVDSTLGFTAWADAPADSHAEAVGLLIAAGAVPFVKSNVPQVLLSSECANPLWGRTLNPFSSEYTSGGSSGGEAALLALDAAPLGLGSDVGGSLRGPATFCGIYSLKPGSGRVPYGGARSSFGGMQGVPCVAGPMGRSVADIVLASKVLYGKPDAARDVAPVPFRDVELPKKLRFGYFTDDGFIKASPVNVRAVQETVDALRAQGHECIPLDKDQLFDSEPCQLFVHLTAADGYRTLFDPIGPDPTDSSVFLLRYMPMFPVFVQKTITWLIRVLAGDAQYADVVAAGHPKSVYDYFAAIERRDAFRAKLHAQLFDKHALDGVISHVFPIPGLPHHGAKELGSAANTMMLYNVADCPAGVVPVTRVSPATDAAPADWWDKKTAPSPLCAEACARFYDAEKMAGLPVAVQIAGRRWEEEKVLAMMAVVDDALGPRTTFGPGSSLTGKASKA